MTIFWGNDLTEDTVGLDILGLRAVDQAIESKLVNGITTISLRGRYFSLLPWALAEFFTLETAGGKATFDSDRLLEFIRRVEFVTVVATHLDSDTEDAGGALGSDLYDELVKEVLAGHAVAFPTAKGGAMLGTYYGPCEALGLLDDAPPSSGSRFRITPRGKAVWECRRNALEGSVALDAIRLGKPITRNIVHDVVAQFSLGALTNSRQEAALLKEALLVAWLPKDDKAREQVVANYNQFIQNIDWIKTHLKEHSDSSAGLIANNYRRCVLGEIHDATSLLWAEYAYRRRCHFALELMLAALTKYLTTEGDSSVETILEAWMNSR
jgi:hypothetical protein